MEIKTTHEIADEHYRNYHYDDTECNVKWVRVDDVLYKLHKVIFSKTCDNLYSLRQVKKIIDELNGDAK